MSTLFLRKKYQTGNARWSLVTCSNFPSVSSSRKPASWKQLNTQERIRSSITIDSSVYAGCCLPLKRLPQPEFILAFRLFMGFVRVLRRFLGFLCHLPYDFHCCMKLCCAFFAVILWFAFIRQLSNACFWYLSIHRRSLRPGHLLRWTAYFEVGQNCYCCHLLPWNFIFHFESFFSANWFSRICRPKHPDRRKSYSLDWNYARNSKYFPFCVSHL